jgi:hypothetical protein
MQSFVAAMAEDLAREPRAWSTRLGVEPGAECRCGVSCADRAIAVFGHWPAARLFVGRPAITGQCGAPGIGSCGDAADAYPCHFAGRAETVHPAADCAGGSPESG